jgi:hypothetical protein
MDVELWGKAELSDYLGSALKGADYWVYDQAKQEVESIEDADALVEWFVSYLDSTVKMTAGKGRFKRLAGGLRW